MTAVKVCNNLQIAVPVQHAINSFLCEQAIMQSNYNSVDGYIDTINKVISHTD